MKALSRVDLPRQGSFSTLRATITPRPGAHSLLFPPFGSQLQHLNFLVLQEEKVHDQGISKPQSGILKGHKLSCLLSLRSSLFTQLPGASHQTVLSSGTIDQFLHKHRSGTSQCFQQWKPNEIRRKGKLKAVKAISHTGSNNEDKVFI